MYRDIALICNGVNSGIKMFILFILCSFLLIITNMILFLAIYERRLISSIKKGELLSGEIIKTYRSPNGRNIIYKKPKVIVEYKGKERILLGIAKIANYRQGQIYNVYYNEDEFPKYVLLDQKNLTIADMIFEIVMCVGVLLVNITYLYIFLPGDQGLISKKYSIIIIPLVYLMTIFPGRRLAKKLFNSRYFSNENNND